MRQTYALNQEWAFHLGEAENADYQGYDDRAWRRVTLPHDWSVEAPFDSVCSSGTGYLPGGIGWYRKRFTLTAEQADKRVSVTFCGVYQHARVWINSHYLGTRAYGYSTFTLDLTGRVKTGENVLCVRAEHAHLADSRWFTGAGIYRDVTLTICEHACAADVFARVKEMQEDRAEISVDIQVTTGRAEAALFDPEGAECACADADENGRARLTVEKPRLWSPEDPYLYTLRTRVKDSGVLSDETCRHFGIRTLRFDPEEGFFLNGVPRKLKGVCLHHDAGVLGAAVPPCVLEMRLRRLKDCGANAIRCSHNPPDPALLDLCDRLGLMVIDEAFDEWEGCKNKWWQGHNVYPPKHYGYAEDFPQWHTQDLTDLIKRDRNHPCVILWSIGNEIDYPNDPYVDPSFTAMTGNNDADKPEQERRYDPCRPNARRLPVIARELTDLAHALDDSRPVTAAWAFPELSNLTGLTDTVDVAGYNYKEHLYAKDHAEYPGRALLGTENSTDAAAWLAVRDLPYVAGQFLWTGADYLGEARGWPVRVSTPGLMDTANREKPLYYQRKALWTDGLCAKLAASVTGNMHDELFVLPSDEKSPCIVSCYTNADTAALYAGDILLGAVKVGKDCRVQWTLDKDHAKKIRVECVRGEEKAWDALYSFGKTTCLHVDSNAETLTPGQWMILECRAMDAQGRLCADAEDLLTVQILGGAALKGIENGNPADLTPFPSCTRPMYRGFAVCYLRAGEKSGKVTVRLETASGAAAEREFVIV